MSSLTLLVPIQAYGETVTKLEFRDPIGKDLRICGFPFKFEAGEAESAGYSHPNAQAIHALIARLSNIPPSAVDTLCLADFAACMEIVTSFFGQGKSPSTLSIDTTTSPGNGGGIPNNSLVSPSRS
jgi:hypothetical protein